MPDSDIILCPINKTVKFNKDELTLLNTRTLRRLQYIKQLEFVYFVFPGCNHSRFEHTIGVTHLLKRITENKKLVIRYLLPTVWPEVNELKVFKNSPSEDVKIEFIKKIIPLCGLLHDIGHGPFSHLSETLLSIVGFPRPFIRKRGMFEEERMDKFKDTVKLHEWIMCEILRYNYGENLKRETEKIKDDLFYSFNIKEEEKSLNSKVAISWAEFLKRRYADIAPILKDIGEKFNLNEELDYLSLRELIAYGACGKIRGIDNLMYGVFDLDRLDYLRRDSFMAGVKYGDVEVDRLLNVSFTFDDPASEENRKLLIDYAKGIASLEHMYTGKDLLYLTTILHPCSAILKNMLIKFILTTEDARKVKESLNTINKWDALLAYLIKIFRMEDPDFMEYLRLSDNSNSNNKSYLRRLLDRDLYKKIAVLHWTDLHPYKREEIIKLAEGKDIVKLWESIERYEGELGGKIYKCLREKGRIENFEEKYGKVVLVNLPHYPGELPDIHKTIVRKTTLYKTFSYHKADEISPILEASYKTSMRNQIVSIYLNPELIRNFWKDKNEKEVLKIITDKFGLSLHQSAQK